MKKSTLLFLFLLFSFVKLFSQKYWQQQVNYKINVTLNDQQHSLRGDIQFEYNNNSPETLSFIWIQLWPNGYKNNETALYKQVAANKEERKRLKDFKERGYIDSLAFTAGEKLCKTEPHPDYIDIVKLILPQPLKPGEKVVIASPFFVKLPGYFSRLGHEDNYYMISQWYPKPAVFDAKGWHEMPYLDQGEFYSEFGNFDVKINLPSGYIVAATGNLQTTTELSAYMKSGTANRKLIDETLMKGSSKVEMESALKKIIPVRTAIVSNPQKTLHFTENNVHDFAWFASKDFIIQYDTLMLPSGRITNAFTFYNYNNTSSWYNSGHYVEDAVRNYSRWLGEYPYETVKAVEGPGNQSSGGMEYPTVTMITSPGADQEHLDAVIAHEVGHNWLYGILATNERDHPWMDEGINTYLQFRYEAEKYRANSIFGNAIPEEIRKKNADDFQAIIYNTINQNIPMEAPIATSSTGFKNRDDYSKVVYLKTAVWMYVMEIVIGRDKMDQALKAYFEQWKFKHPYPADMQETFTNTTHLNLTEIFEALNKKGKVSN